MTEPDSKALQVARGTNSCS